MKILRFNELKAGTYWNAAEKLAKLGHKKRSSRLKKWAITKPYQQAGIDIDDFEFNCYIIKEHLKNGKIIQYKTTEEFVGTVKADFHSFPWEMISDNPEDGKDPYISVFFGYQGYDILPFGIVRNDKGEVEVSKDVSNIEETALDKMMPEIYNDTFHQRGFMRFSNRMDAIRFLKLCKHPVTREEFDKFFEENETAPDLKEKIIEMFSQLKLNQLYTEE